MLTTEEHLSFVHPRWLRGVLMDSDTLPIGTTAIYVSGDSAGVVVLSVAPGSFSVTQFSWDASPEEGQFVRAKTESIPLSRVERMVLRQSIGGLNAHGGQPEHFDADAVVVLANPIGSLSEEINLPLTDDDYGQNPERRARVIRTFVDAMTLALPMKENG